MLRGEALLVDSPLAPGLLRMEDREEESMMEPGLVAGWISPCQP